MSSRPTLRSASRERVELETVCMCLLSCMLHAYGTWIGMLVNIRGGGVMGDCVRELSHNGAIFHLPCHS
ncbi:hypothetical protein BDU57DRAFT_508774, partial [Ampelomyces quisqualis]